jgi:hypothetical protein
MQTFHPAIIVDDPLYDPLLTTANGFVNVPVHWPYDGGEVINFWPVRSLKSKTFWFVATSHDLSVKILGSLDGGDTFPVTAEAAFTVAVGAVVVKSIGNDYTALKIQVKPAVDDVHGTLSVTAHGTSAPDTADVGISVQPDVNINGVTVVGGKVPVVDAAVGASLSSMDAKLPAKGSATMAGAIPVTLATDGPGVANLVTLAGAIKAEDAIHSSGDSGIMALGVRSDAATAKSADGDYHPFLFDANGALWVQLAGTLSLLLDSIDVAKMSKGAITTVHSAITATATSAEVDCRGFNSLLVHWVSSATDKTWIISITGATGSGLTFVPQIDKTTGLAISAITTDISGFFVINDIPDYIKVVATETDDGATVTCKVQPFNS